MSSFKNKQWANKKSRLYKVACVSKAEGIFQQYKAWQMLDVWCVMLDVRDFGLGIAAMENGLHWLDGFMLIY